MERSEKSRSIKRRLQCERTMNGYFTAHAPLTCSGDEMIALLSNKHRSKERNLDNCNRFQLQQLEKDGSSSIYVRELDRDKCMVCGFITAMDAAMRVGLTQTNNKMFFLLLLNELNFAYPKSRGL